jgi:LCP family protein required for cell wall assembly
VSFPRDIAEFPLWDGTIYHGKINSLMTYAKNHPDRFPEGPLPSLVHELSFLLGTPIHYYAAVDIDGFRKMVDAVGGVTVDVQRDIRDARYDWLDGSERGFFLTAGEHLMDGRLALAYVRSRYGVGDNDFTRAARQQQLLVALRAKLTDPAMVVRIPDLLKVAGDTIRTNFPPDRIDEMVSLILDVNEADIRRVVLQPPAYSVHPPTSTTGGTYILRLHMDAVRQLSVSLFGEDSEFWTGVFDAAGSPIPASPPP